MCLLAFSLRVRWKNQYYSHSWCTQAGCISKNILQKAVLSMCFFLVFLFCFGIFFLFYSGGVCTFLVFCINTSLPHTGPPSRDQSPCLLCPRDTPSLCTWRWPASVPLLHHPLTVEGQGGPPLSTGPAAMRRGLMSGVGWGNWGRHRGERGLDPLTAPDHWSKHWLIATDPWSVEPAPSLSSCSPISSAAAIRVTVWQGGGKNTDGRSFSLFLSLSRALFLIVKTRTGSPFHSALPHISDSPPAGVKDCIWTAAGGVGGWNGETTVLHVQTLKKKKKKDIFMLDTLCGEVSSQLITWHLYTTILWFILLRPIDAQHGGSGALHCG